MTRKRLDTIAQYGMPLFGVTAVLLLSFGNPWGFIAGACGQAFFFINAFVPRFQPGFFVTVVAFSVSWAIGIYNNYGLLSLDTLPLPF
jgi:hypothetical protein